MHQIRYDNTTLKIPVDIFSMTNPDNLDHQDVALWGIDDAIAPHPHAVVIFLPPNLFKSQNL